MINMSAKEITDIPRKEISRNTREPKTIPRKGVQTPQNKHSNEVKIVPITNEELLTSFSSYQDEVNKNLSILYEQIQQYEQAFNNISTFIAKHDEELTTLNGVVVRMSNGIKQELTNVVNAVSTMISEQIDSKIEEMLSESEEYDEIEDYQNEEISEYEEQPENKDIDSEEE